MIPIVLKDTVPRQLAYPVGDAYLSEQLGADVQLEDLALFFLFTSGIQLDHYDPLTSSETTYPVLALDHEPPPLVGTAKARLRDDRRRRAELLGVIRTGRAAEDQPEAPLGADLDASVAIVVFPVKTRMRRRVTDAIETQGIKLIRNWLAAAPEVQKDQKPLVLLFDEISGRVSARFAMQEGPRRLYR